jgi:hypothetical protein
VILPPSVSAIVSAACWRDVRLEGVDDRRLSAALDLARRNRVAGRLARVFPDRLSAEIEAADTANRELRVNLATVSQLLRSAGIDAVLVKFDQKADAEYGNFDLVTGDDGFAMTREALRTWTVRTSRHPLEPDKVLLHPRSGPAAHIHRGLSWFGIEVISAPQLRAEATIGIAGLLVPGHAEALRSHVAHGCFQNLAYDLGELISIRALMTPEVMELALRRAVREGWGRSFSAALTTVRLACDRLDAGLPVRLPVALPVTDAASAGVEHAMRQLRRGHVASAARELGLRGPLLIAKRRAMRRERNGRHSASLVGISGPDGVGKTSVAMAAVDEAARRGFIAVRIHPYGCLICRTLGRFAPLRPASSGAHEGMRRGSALHGCIDALEMELRIRAASASAGRRAIIAERESGRPLTPLVITDRSPVDGLVKNDRNAGPATAWFVRLARVYDALVLLDARAGWIAARDPEHSEAEIELLRGRFATWSAAIADVLVVPVDTVAPTRVATVLIESL